MGQNVTLLPLYCSGQMAKTLRYCSTFKKDTVSRPVREGCVIRLSQPLPGPDHGPGCTLRLSDNNQHCSRPQSTA
jgi:hypothetical protein